MLVNILHTFSYKAKTNSSQIFKFEKKTGLLFLDDLVRTEKIRDPRSLIQKVKLEKILEQKP